MIFAFLNSAFETARLDGVDLSNAERSAAFVSCLASELRKHYKAVQGEGQPKYAVFSRDYPGNQKEFGLNELMFDIVAAEIATVKSVRGIDITAIRGAEWLIESELKRTDSRDVLVDFNKLVIGQAKNKLLVVAAGSSVASWIEAIAAELICAQSANFYLALLPHPNEWYFEDCPQVELKVLCVNGMANHSFDPISLGMSRPAAQL